MPWGRVKLTGMPLVSQGGRRSKIKACMNTPEQEFDLLSHYCRITNGESAYIAYGRDYVETVLQEVFRSTRETDNAETVAELLRDRCFDETLALLGYALVSDDKETRFGSAVLQRIRVHDIGPTFHHLALEVPHIKHAKRLQQEYSRALRRVCEMIQVRPFKELLSETSRQDCVGNIISKMCDWKAEEQSSPTW